MESTSGKSKEKKSKKAYIPLIVLLVLVLVGGGFWYFKFLKYVSTDDAVIDGDFATVSPKISGRIMAEYAEEGDSVRFGQLLVVIDSSDLYAQKLQAEAQVKFAMANLSAAETKYKADLQGIAVTQINADKAKSDFERAQRQKESDVITVQQFEDYKKNNQTTSAMLSTAQAQLKASSAQVESYKAAIDNAKALVNVITTQLLNTKVYSPLNGIVAKRWLMQGEMVSQAGQAIFTINSSNKLWVSVYIEETKLKYIHMGQGAEFTIDAIPNAMFTGKIIYIGDNTASKFALIPPTNANGNFTKVTQRIQLKVSIDSANSGSLKDYDLFQGMSVVMKLLK
jgi:membrane fusion protein, multidrug efflux system